MVSGFWRLGFLGFQALAGVGFKVLGLAFIANGSSVCSRDAQQSCHGILRLGASTNQHPDTHRSTQKRTDTIRSIRTSALPSSKTVHAATFRGTLWVMTLMDHGAH